MAIHHHDLDNCLILSSLELSSNCLEPSGNNKNGGKDLMTLCWPREWYNHMHKLGNLIT